MSLIGNFLSPGARIFKLLAYNGTRDELRGLGLVDWLSKRVIPDDPQVLVQEVLVEGMDSAWFEPKKRLSDKVMLYFHGGGYCVCSWQTHRSLIGRLSRAAGMKTLAVNYRLAPENPFPAAIEDGVKAYQFLLQTHAPENIVLGGDSAGGGLCMGLMLALKQQKISLPSKVIALSPWLDLSVPEEAYTGFLIKDPMLTIPVLKVWANRYLDTTHPQNPLASPLYGDLTGLPPILIHVGEREMLLSDTIRFVEKAREAGVDAHMQLWPGMVHVFQFLHTVMPEAKRSIEELGDFLRK
jgi:monoterpene epsilon-lactone hydrolase